MPTHYPPTTHSRPPTTHSRPPTTHSHPPTTHSHPPTTHSHHIHMYVHTPTHASTLCTVHVYVRVCVLQPSVAVLLCPPLGCWKTTMGPTSFMIHSCSTYSPCWTHGALGGPHRWGTGVWGRASQVGYWSVGEGLTGGTLECGRRGGEDEHVMY